MANSTNREETLRTQPIAAAAEDDMPEDIRLEKEKLERETGKKYKYRPPRKDLPSISHMLVHGAPGSENRKKTWFDMVKYPLVLAILFFISLLIFHHAPHANSRRAGFKHKLPRSRKGAAADGGRGGSLHQEIREKYASKEL